MFLGVMLWQLFLPGGLVPGSFRAAAGGPGRMARGELSQRVRRG